MKSMCVALFSIVLLYSSASLFAQEKSISKIDYPNQWCFSVDEITLTCENGIPTFRVQESKVPYARGVGKARIHCPQGNLTFAFNDKDYEKLKELHADDLKCYDDNYQIINNWADSIRKGKVKFFERMAKKLCR